MACISLLLFWLYGRFDAKRGWREGCSGGNQISGEYVCRIENDHQNDSHRIAVDPKEDLESGVALFQC